MTLSRYREEDAKLANDPMKMTLPDRIGCGALLVRITIHMQVANEAADGTRGAVTENGRMPKKDVRQAPVAVIGRIVPSTKRGRLIDGMP